MTEQRKEETLTKDKLVGMQVIDSNGNLVGKVKDVAFTVGKMGIALLVETGEGENKDIQWEDVKAAGDVILLKPTSAQAKSGVEQPQPKEQSQQICPACKKPLTYIEQYDRWYCYRCKKYA